MLALVLLIWKCRCTSGSYWQAISSRSVIIATVAHALLIIVLNETLLAVALRPVAVGVHVRRAFITLINVPSSVNEDWCRIAYLALSYVVVTFRSNVKMSRRTLAAISSVRNKWRFTRACGLLWISCSRGTNYTLCSGLEMRCKTYRYT